MYLTINLANMYVICMWKTLKILWKEIKEDVNKWGINSQCLCIRILNVADMLIHHNLIFRFNVNPMKILAVYFVDINKLILKLFRKTQY